MIQLRSLKRKVDTYECFFSSKREKNELLAFKPKPPRKEEAMKKKSPT